MTKALYRRLSLTFGFITLFDHANYWADYFARAEDKARFLQQIVIFPRYGDPAFTLSDVEKAVKSRARQLNDNGKTTNLLTVIVDTGFNWQSHKQPIVLAVVLHVSSRARMWAIPPREKLRAVGDPSVADSSRL
jgi:hypothetical protein